VLFTLGQSEVSHFHFVTTKGSGADAPLATFEVIPPTFCTSTTAMLGALKSSDIPPVDLSAIANGGSPTSGVLKGLSSASAAPPPPPPPPPPTKPSKPCPKIDETIPRLNLTVIVVPDGFAIKARGGNVAPGCKDVGPGLAIPATGGRHDYAALTKCIADLKAVAPEFAADRAVVISANPNIPTQTVFATIDAVRDNGDGGVLFPDVAFGIAR
jgi:hypothetical protein